MKAKKLGTMKEKYQVILITVNIFQVQSANLKEIHDFIIIPILHYNSNICIQAPPKIQK